MSEIRSEVRHLQDSSYRVIWLGLIGCGRPAALPGTRPGPRLASLLGPRTARTTPRMRGRAPPWEDRAWNRARHAPPCKGCAVSCAVLMRGWDALAVCAQTRGVVGWHPYGEAGRGHSAVSQPATAGPSRLASPPGTTGNLRSSPNGRRSRFSRQQRPTGARWDGAKDHHSAAPSSVAS